MDLTALRVELTKSDIAAAEGITVRAESPVLALCRKLIDAGYDPATPLNVYRGDTLALRVSSIVGAAGLDIAGDGVGFRPRKKPVAAPPIRSNRSGATRPRATITPIQDAAT